MFFPLLFISVGAVNSVGEANFPTPPPGNTNFPIPPPGNTNFPMPPPGNTNFPIPPPGITHSLVNLGRMDISFHLNANKDASTSHGDEPCLCSSFKNQMSSTSDLLSKILSSNQLFKNPLTSSFCCGDSHEHVQEDTVILEMGPKHGQASTSGNLNSNSYYNTAFYPSMMLDQYPFNKYNFPSLTSYTSNLGSLGSGAGSKAKAIEIFFFPKKKDGLKFEFGKSSSFNSIKPNNKFDKKEIQIVGDKQFKNDFKSLAFRPLVSLSPSISVKKDLAVQEKKMQTKTKQESPKETVPEDSTTGVNVDTKEPKKKDAPLIESKPINKPNSV